MQSHAAASKILRIQQDFAQRIIRHQNAGMLYAGITRHAHHPVLNVHGIKDGSIGVRTALNRIRVFATSLGPQVKGY